MLSASDSENLVRMAVWGGLVLFAILVLAIGFVWLRRSVLSGRTASTDSAPWDL